MLDINMKRRHPRPFSPKVLDQMIAALPAGASTVNGDFPKRSKDPRL